MKTNYLRLLPGLLLCLIVTSCSKPPEDLIYGEYEWTKRNGDGSRDKITILEDGTFVQNISSIETIGNWKEITDYGDYTLDTRQAGNDWDATLILFSYPDGREQYFILNTPFDEYGNCRSTFRQREFRPIDTSDTRIHNEIGYELDFFAKPVDITDKDFAGCTEADISKVYNCSVTDDNYRDIGTAQVDIDYEASNGSGSWTYSAQWEPQYRRILPTEGQGRILGDTLYDSKLGTIALGYMKIDTMCCDHRVYMVVGNSLQSFR